MRDGTEYSTGLSIFIDVLIAGFGHSVYHIEFIYLIVTAEEIPIL